MGLWPRLAVAVLCVSLAAAAWGADAGAATDLATRLAPIRQQLGSPDYATREAGQKELDKIPPALVELLRPLAAAEADPEAKARLEARIAAMEIHNLLNPPPISLDVTNASLDEVAAAINKQLGSAASVLSAGGAGKFTLHADQQPFWQVIEQLNRQNPLTISTPSSSSFAYAVRLTPLAAGAAPRTYGITETFAYSAAISGQPADGTWSVTITFYSDPRIRIARYSSMLHLDKLTDQNGHNLLPLLASSSTSMSNPTRPVISWTSRASLNAADGVRRLAELRGAAAVALLEKERTIVFDLTKPHIPPVSTERGLLSVEQDANGAWTFRSQPDGDGPPVAAVAGTPPGTTVIRQLDANGSTISTSYVSVSSGSPLTLSLARGAAAPPAKVEVTWPEKTRDYVLPFNLKDVELAAPAAVRADAAR